MALSAVDVLLIHEGKAHAADNPVNLMPMGLISMADWLDRHGHSAEVMHLPVERALDPDFSLVSAVAQASPRLLCMDLHWHQQSRAVIDTAAELRAALPHTSLVLGGYTASAFAEEILERFDHVDYVIRGDGEVGLLQLADALEAGTPPDGLPNLSYRTPTGVRHSAHRHVNDAQDLGRYSFSRFELLRHQQTYNQALVMEGEINVAAPPRPGIFYCNVGRGCPYDCPFCGGCREAQRRIGGRKRFAHRPAEAMLRDLRRLPEFNLDGWYNTFDPVPDHRYFLDLFERIRAEGLELSLMHECLHLPGEEFLTSFARTFGPRKRLDFVMLTASDRLRLRTKDNYFSRDDLLRTLEATAHHGIPSDVCFLTGLPFEEETHVRQTLDFVEELGQRFDHVSVNAEVLAIEPLAPMNLDPEGWGVRSHARTFADYYAGHAQAAFYGFSPAAYTAERAQELAEDHHRALDKGRARRRRDGPSEAAPRQVPLQGSGCQAEAPCADEVPRAGATSGVHDSPPPAPTAGPEPTWGADHAARLRQWVEEGGGALAAGWKLDDVRAESHRVVLVVRHPDAHEPLEFMLTSPDETAPCIAHYDAYNLSLFWNRATECRLDAGQTDALSALQKLLGTP